MTIQMFDKSLFAKSKSFAKGDKYSSGQVTIIGGSSLFHGAPLLALKGASRIVAMTYFSSPDEDREIAEKIKASLSSFVWVGIDEIENYINKSDAVLIGPGLMRSHVKEQTFSCDLEGERTRNLSLNLFKKFPDKKWLVDGGSLQVLKANEIPKGALVTPNHKEFEMLFGQLLEINMNKRCKQVLELAKKYGLTILTKDAVSVASDGKEIFMIEGGNDGLIKGGVGDVIAGVAVGFLARNDALLSAAMASYLVKKAAEKLSEKRSLMFNSDDVVNLVPEIYGEVIANL